MASCRQSGGVIKHYFKVLTRSGRSAGSLWQSPVGSGPSTSSSAIGTACSWLQGCTHGAQSTAHTARSFRSYPCNAGLAAGALIRTCKGRLLQQHGHGGLPSILLLRSAVARSHPPQGAMSACGRTMWSLSRSSSGGMLGNVFAPGKRVTNILVLMGVAVYLLEQRYPVVVPLLARVNYLIDRGQYWRLVTSGFVHSNLIHLLTNMLSLYWVGPMLEGVLGPRRFVVVYLGSAVASNLLSYYMQPPRTMSVGASGSVCGILGGYVAYRFCNRGIMGFGGPEMTWLAQIVGINILLQMALPGIDGWSHLGGALGGFGLVYMMLSFRRRPPSYRQWRS